MIQLYGLKMGLFYGASWKDFKWFVISKSCPGKIS